MVSVTMKAGRMAAMQSTQMGAAKALRAVPVRFGRNSRKTALQVSAAVQFDYDTKVFKKELVKFADTEEYIYRCAGIKIEKELLLEDFQLSHFIDPGHNV